MARLGREKKREQKRTVPAEAPQTPIEVHVPSVPGGSTVGTGGAGSALVGGVPVVAAPGEEVQHAVLNRLHQIARAAGHPVLATVHDERIGYVVPLRVDPDGSSHFTAEPLRTPGAPEPASDAAPSRRPAADHPTHVLRSLPVPPGSEHVRDTAQTFPMRAVPEPPRHAQGVPGTPPAPASAGPPEDQSPGTVAPPKGEFGPPPVMDARPHPAVPETDHAPGPVPAPEGPTDRAPVPFPPPEAPRAPQPLPTPEATRAPHAPRHDRSAEHLAVSDLVPDDPKPTPARGFDAVAEAVLGDEPLTAPGDSPAPARLAEPVGRINEAVRAGRTDVATRLVERTVTEASATLGPEHPKVLRLRELAAYIAYLAGDPVRAFHLSLDLVTVSRRAGDAEAAYGNIQSAATAWRAVRDPAQGLDLGRDLIGRWTELAAEDGPAADDIEELESARARMDRLTDRARKSASTPGS
ncbi:tetratricopeptide repeat protein [Streptomyces sp. TRM68367]|uniref:tetratricopeptide repeat protein n=1 Tax=Streptomyces sp. TRM68367 TaxID=2758415 RepID=UPI00165CBCC6|nr:tetratricopeptide repeat protein [Streptomyces sp. TRM68367]MBC9726168.1 tetratricopeptide repeat protein [Streptomyces sp. TRM68367]